MKEKYIEFLNKMAFEIHESYMAGQFIDKMIECWNKGIDEFRNKKIPVSRIILAKIGPVTTMLGDTFHYKIDNENQEATIQINDKIVFKG